MKPFSTEFNAATMAMANRVCPTGYDIADHAPDNLPDLIDQIERTGRICVSRANSEVTVFGGPDNAELNYAFRAWHDWTHYHIRAEFSLTGEARVAMQQVADLATVYDAAFAEKYKPLILAEVIGQALYKEFTGEFPIDQRAFDTVFMLAHGLTKASPSWFLACQNTQHDNFNYVREIPADYHAMQSIVDARYHRRDRDYR